MSTTESVNTPRSHAPVPDPVKHAIAAQIALGASQTQAAKDFNVSRQTVNKIAQDVKDATLEALGDWRTLQATKAVAAVNAGLDCDDDAYKRAGIGVQVLKGLGHYKEDSTSQVAVVFTSLPGAVLDAAACVVDVDATLISDAGSDAASELGLGTTSE